MIIDIQAAIQKLQSGQIVAVPSETVYGLAAVYNQLNAVRQIFIKKNRPLFDPLICHVASFEEAQSLSSEDLGPYNNLLEKFWPGPLTLVVKKSKLVDDLITSGEPTVAIRMPGHPLFLQLIREVGPLVAPSANQFGKTSPTSAQDVELDYNGDIFVVDGGKSDRGIESTILTCENGKWEILRPGAISKSEIEATLKLEVSYRGKHSLPGGLEDHYQPNAPFYLFYEDTNTCLPRMELPQDPFLAARSLYSSLRLAASHYPSGFCLFWDKISKPENLWYSIHDRLLKASTNKGNPQ